MEVRHREQQREVAGRAAKRRRKAWMMKVGLAMTIEELTRALILMEVRVAELERRIETTRDLLSRCLIIPVPMEPSSGPRFTKEPRKL
jgi:hypothetical protein